MLGKGEDSEHCGKTQGDECVGSGYCFYLLYARWFLIFDMRFKRIIGCIPSIKIDFCSAKRFQNRSINLLILFSHLRELAVAAFILAINRWSWTKFLSIKMFKFVGFGTFLIRLKQNNDWYHLVSTYLLCDMRLRKKWNFMKWEEILVQFYWFLITFWPKKESAWHQNHGNYSSFYLVFQRHIFNEASSNPS